MTQPAPPFMHRMSSPGHEIDLRRSSAIVAVKVVHSAIFLVNSAAILHVFVAGIRDRPSRWTGAALAVALTESAVFVANRGRCPLTQVTEGLGAESGRVLDIFLPRWFADRIPQFCTPPLLIGVLALVVNAWRHAERRQVSDQRPGSRTRRAIVTRPVRARILGYGVRAGAAGRIVVPRA